MRTVDIIKDEVKKYLKVHYDFNVRLWERHLLQHVVDQVEELDKYFKDYLVDKK